MNVLMIQLRVGPFNGETRAYDENGQWMGTFPLYGTAVRMLKAWFPKSPIKRVK